MTSEQLKQILATIEQGLTANKQIVQQPLIDELRIFINELRAHPATQQIVAQMQGQTAQLYSGVYAADFDIDKLLAGLSNALDIEQKLIGSEGDTVIKLCNSLQNRHMLLGLIARFM